MHAQEVDVIVAVNCVKRGNCFCTSMNTGPGAKEGYDLAMTEVLEGGKHILWWMSAAPLGNR